MGCVNTQVHQAFAFQDSGNHEYRTTTLELDLIKKFGHPFPQIKVLLIETPTLVDASFIAQNEAFDSIGHDIEEMQVMSVVACPTQEAQSGYHTTKQTAVTLANGQQSFRLTLLASDGQVIKSTAAPLNSRELRKWLQDK
jgi:hypothetical protein